METAAAVMTSSGDLEKLTAENRLGEAGAASRVDPEWGLSDRRSSKCQCSEAGAGLVCLRNHRKAFPDRHIQEFAGMFYNHTEACDSLRAS